MIHNSELRQDIVSGDWIVVTPRRAERPEQFIKKEKRTKAPIKGCPFENPQKSGNGKPVLIYKNLNNKGQNSGDWTLQIIKNKYPAFIPKDICPKISQNGPYPTINGVGHHEILITHHHDKNFPRLSLSEEYLVFS